MNRTALACTSIASIGVLGAAALVSAGPLNPPAGAVGSTLKTLVEVEPRVVINQTNTPGDANSVFRISQPGSYYLGGNVSVPTGRRGIEIAASGVTVDLNGFEIVGAGGSLDGIGVDGTVQNAVAIRNGGIRQMGGSGINLPGAATSGLLIERVVVSDGGGAGILAGAGVIVRQCSVARNQGDGMNVGPNASIEDCNASFQQSGGDGIDTGEESVVARCVANANTGFGIRAGLGSVVSICTASDNTQTGIAVASDGLISQCAAVRNLSHGFSANSRSTIERCSSIGNTGNGITGGSTSRIIGNLCQGNGLGAVVAAGIRTSSGGNVIDSNQCVGNGVGIEVGGLQSLIVRNVCSGNTVNFVIVGGNRIGPIVTAGSNAAAINGSAADGTLGTTDPHANIAY